MISMYPAVMQAEQYPFRLVGVYRNPTERELDNWTDGFSVVAECDIDTDAPIYPKVHEGKLVFPVGRFSVSLATPEFMCARERGHIRKVHRVSVYEQLPLFREFITEMFEHRQAAKAGDDTVNAWQFKILMNSLYGKFGQRGRRYEIVDGCEPNDIDVWDEYDDVTGEISHWRKFGGVVQSWVEEDEARDSHPAIAAHVTSFARLKLWAAIEAAGREHCFYADTDSLVLDQEGFDRVQHLLDSSKLGMWELERTLDHIVLHGPKDYQFDDKVKCKGVRATATWLDDCTVVQDRFVGFRGLLREGSLDAPIVHPITKRLSRRYTKGVVKPGGVVLPFALEDV